MRKHISLVLIILQINHLRLRYGATVSVMSNGTASSDRYCSITGWNTILVPGRANCIIWAQRQRPKQIPFEIHVLHEIEHELPTHNAQRSMPRSSTSSAFLSSPPSLTTCHPIWSLRPPHAIKTISHYSNKPDNSLVLKRACVISGMICNDNFCAVCMYL
jgi:hypothetical protein